MVGLLLRFPRFEWKLCTPFLGVLSQSNFFPLSTDGSSSRSGPAVTVTNLSPITSPYTSLLQQTEDQNSYCEVPFVSLGSPPLCDDYLMSLGEGEGISDLFDDLDPLSNLDDLLCNWRVSLRLVLGVSGKRACSCRRFKNQELFFPLHPEVKLIGEWSLPAWRFLRDTDKVILQKVFPI